MYPILFWDADETLLDFRRAEACALRTVFTEDGLPADDAFLDAYRSINNALWAQYNRGEIEKSVITRTRFTTLFERYLIPLDGVAYNERYLDCLSTFGFTLPGAAELCAALAAAGKEMYILTNGIDRVQKGRIARSGLLPYFRGVFVSEAFGVGKPHKAFFDAALHAAGDPDRSDVLVIGDSLTADVEGGRRAGLDTCWCDFQKTGLPHHAAYRVEDFTQLQNLLTGEPL